MKQKGWNTVVQCKLRGGANPWFCTETNSLPHTTTRLSAPTHPALQAASFRGREQFCSISCFYEFFYFYVRNMHVKFFCSNISIFHSETKENKLLKLTFYKQVSYGKTSTQQQYTVRQLIFLPSSLKAQCKCAYAKETDLHCYWELASPSPANTTPVNVCCSHLLWEENS